MVTVIEPATEPGLAEIPAADEAQLDAAVARAKASYPAWRALAPAALSINSNTLVRVATPFGGFKQSGYGRELEPRALDTYTELKSIFFATS
jgi:acyl-CoA reductase-like NAD-dependent aldehyde dehydrogenase